MHLSLLPLALALFSVVDAQNFTRRSWDEAFALANATVAQLTTAEKAGIAAGVGQFTSRCVGNTSPVARLGIPALCMNDGPAGIRLVNNVTGFPAGINAAATFSRRLMQLRGQALAEEFRGKGIHVYLGPAMDLMRNPMAGRAWEGFGPDPYLSGEAAYYTIIGVQNVGVQACAKHFNGYNQEHWRYGMISNIDDRTMHELYLYPFLRAIEANVTSVMCSYNQFNGTSACQNPGLIGPSGLLRQNGFKGYVVSDWGATHASADTNANSGLDMEQPGDNIVIGGGSFGTQGTNLVNVVNSGKVDTNRLDQMAARVLAGYYLLGQENGYPAVSFGVQQSYGTTGLNENVNVRSATHLAIAREVAAASTVLLKNNRTSSAGAGAPAGSGTTLRGLPVALSQVKSIAIVGLDGIMPNVKCNDLNECNDGTLGVGWGSGSNYVRDTIPPVTAIQDFVGSSATITTSLTNDLNAGPAAAKGKDLCIVLGNADSGELGAYTIVVGNEGDRNDLNLWYKEGSLIQAVANVCSNTIAVIHSVGPVDLSWSNHPNITGIIFAGLPGEQTGPALVDVLFGAVNPSGRLPFSVDENPSSYGTTIVTSPGFPIGFPTIDYTEGLNIDYRYMDAQGIKPRFPFGTGLSYTTFAYSGLKLTTTSTGATATFTVRNTGGVAGTEIPQMYLTFPAAANSPKRVLRGFEEVGPLAPGASQTVTMTMNSRELSVWDVVKQQWARVPGTFTATVGASIDDVRLTGTFVSA
ncbi:unnamed protein product [Mycena citricolor]|nr:unnamed protein product [Mycena citricolor]